MLCSSASVTDAQSRRPSSEGQAFITSTEARFVFPRDTSRSFRYDVPLKGTYPVSPEYMWDVRWPGTFVRDGQDPEELALIYRWKPGGPRVGPLAQLVAGLTVDPLINCLTCDLALYVDPERDITKVFATVEDDRLVFHVRGREAVQHIFPVIPDRVTFAKRVRHVTDVPHGPGDIEESQTVLVNCREKCVTSHPRQDLVELAALRSSGGTVSRRDFALRIELPQGKSVILKDDTTAGMRFINHRYTGYLKKIRSHLIELHRYEGGSYLLVDDSTGIKTRIPGVPVISPDGRRFVSTNFDIGAAYDPNLIEVWNVESRKPRKEFYLESERWSPSDAVWRDTVVLDFSQNFFFGGSLDSVRTVRARLIRKGKTWIMSKAP